MTAPMSADQNPDREKKMSSLDYRILRWERKLLRYGQTDRADYIVHMLNLLRHRKAREEGAAS